MPQKVKGYFYHISQQLSPKDHVLAPKRQGRNRDPQEPDVPRICVCPTVAGCLSAIGPSLQYLKRVRVFQTKDNVSAVVPFGKHASNPEAKPVLDSYITQEKWLIKKASFKFIGYIDLGPLEYLLEYNPGDPDQHNTQMISMHAFSEMEKRGLLWE